MQYISALLAVGLLLIAGCIGGPAAGPPTQTASPTTDLAPYPNTTASVADGPKERPERPATLNESTVADYIHTFEYRYAYNSLWFSERSEVNLDCGVESTEQVAAGYNVTVSCTGYSNTQGESGGNETATVLHADWGTQDVRYYVDANSTLRSGAIDFA